MWPGWEWLAVIVKQEEDDCCNELARYTAIHQEGSSKGYTVRLHG